MREDGLLQGNATMTVPIRKTYLVCGGRNFANIRRGPNNISDETRRQYRFVMDKLDEILPHHPDDEMQMPYGKIISGGAAGVDTAAINFAVSNWLEFEEFRANWQKDGKRAGPIRNQRMLDEGKPDVVVAFPGGVGTADMVRRARKAGIPVIEVTYP